MQNLHFAAPCLLGLEGLVADELRRMNMENVEASNGRVTFTGDESAMVKANICSRYAERILLEMGNFSAVTFDELFEKTKALPWEEFIGSEDAFPVVGSCLNSVLHSEPDCQKIIKKAVVERLKTVYRKAWFNETGSEHQIRFLIMKNNVSIGFNTSGAGLHKRGYRSNAVIAPIKETLAAAIADLAHVRPDSTVYDPCCGSGTLLIEAAYKALNVAPGFRRRFACERWDWVRPEVFSEQRAGALERIRHDSAFKAIGGDIDSEAVELTVSNAKKAAVGGKFNVQTCDINNFEPKTEKGIVLCNPPYGERLLDFKSAREIYKIMGKKFERREGFSYYIISPDEEFEQIFGRPADKRRKLYNGMLKCQLYMYFK